MSYARVSSHLSMVFDDHRNGLYARALRDLVTPDTVVLDLGAGLGIHGLIAAAAGAKRVYLVEPEAVVEVAREIAHTNGLSDRVVILQGRIEDIVLPEKVDLIVSVFTGNLLYSEDLLPSLFHARDCYLKPGGKLVPDFAELVLVPVSAPGLHGKYIGRWSEPNFDLDFSAGRRFAANEILWLGRDELDTVLLAAGSVVSTVDFSSAKDADCNGVAACRIERSGLCHGLLGWIRIRLGKTWLSTDPSGPEVHWRNGFLPLDPPVSVEAGEEIVMSLQRPMYGDWIWTFRAHSGTRRHSSFLGRSDGLQCLRTIAPDNRPTLSVKGEIALHVLEGMRQGLSNKEMAERLVEAASDNELKMEDALRQVQNLALRYARQT